MFVNDGSSEKLRENQPAIWRPAKRIDNVAERRVTTREFFPLQQAAAFSAIFLQPDVIALEVILLSVKMVAHGIDDPAVGSKGERGDIFIDIEQRLFDVRALRARWRQRAAAN